jgi:hypothetical protein
MSFFRAAFTRQRGSDTTSEPWSRFDSVERFSYSLMEAGVDTDEARELLRASKPHFARLENARELAERRREAREYRRDVNRDSTAIAAAKLRGECGFEEEPDPYAGLGGEPSHYYAGHTEWQGFR